MPSVLELSPPLTLKWNANALLPASKSLSNRWLILEALSAGDISVAGHSDAEDTLRLQNILKELPEIADAGAGGTTFRFALAYLCALENYSGTIRGTPRLHERPIKPLVDALLALGADIEYIERDGFPPLRIQGRKLVGSTVKLNAEISSQFLSAILLIAPAMKGELKIDTDNKITSKPYLDMTLELLRKTGTAVHEDEGLITARFDQWQSGAFNVEKDWSSASYWYALATLAPQAEIFLPGLRLNSLQGDAATARIFSHFGIISTETEEGISLTKGIPETTTFEYDFISQPDLAQTIAVVVAGMRKKAKFRGLESLRRKETDRIQAIRNELSKINVHTSEPSEGELLIDASEADFSRELIVDTYDDHRMALAFAPLCLLQYRLLIRDPDVVKKSYPAFWSELRKAGFQLKENEY